MSRCLVLLAVLCPLACCGSAFSGSALAAWSGGLAENTCGPAGDTTLAHGARARVYVQNHSVYGCVSRGGRQVRLGSDALCPRSGHLGPVAVAGELAAYAVRSCGVDTASTQVIVRRLSDGARLSSRNATEGSTGVESFQSVGSVVVLSDGAVAWIGTSSSIVSHRSITEVLEQSGDRVRRLDQGSGIRPGSLTLHGPKLTWKHGGQRRSATLG
jgi:hypothetical protein